MSTARSGTRQRMGASRWGEANCSAVSNRGGAAHSPISAWQRPLRKRDFTLAGSIASAREQQSLAFRSAPSRRWHMARLEWCASFRSLICASSSHVAALVISRVISCVIIRPKGGVSCGGREGRARSISSGGWELRRIAVPRRLELPQEAAGLWSDVARASGDEKPCT